MAKRYSPLTVVVLMGAFALVGYLGARVSQKQALRDHVGSPQPAVHLADEKKVVAPSERNGEMLAATTPADTAKSVAAPADTRAPTPLAAAPPLAPNESTGESTAASPAATEPAQPTPPVLLFNPSSSARDSGQASAGGKAEMLSNRGDTARSHEREPRFAERVAAARQPVLGESDTGVEKPGVKHTRTHQSRYREVAENSGLPGRSQSPRYAARGDMPTPPAQGFRLLPFLPFFLPF